MKIKKSLVVGLLLIAVLAIFIGYLRANRCGCAETYMGAHYVGSICIYNSQGEMIERYCYYEY